MERTRISLHAAFWRVAINLLYLTMALTSLKISEESRLQFITDSLENFTRVLVYTCNEDWEPQGEPAISADKRDEETFHKNLRKEAKEKDHYIPERSTNPEWNPDFKEEVINEEETT